MNSFTALFFSFWWLIFPVGGMLMGLFAMISHHRTRSETLKMIKSYADQGKEPPKALLDLLRSDEDRAYDYAYRRGYYRRYRPGRPWWQVAVFGALCAGFTYAGQNTVGQQATVFTALGLAFGVAATVMLVMAIIGAISGAGRRDLPPPHDHDD